MDEYKWVNLYQKLEHGPDEELWREEILEYTVVFGKRLFRNSIYENFPGEKMTTNFSIAFEG